MQNSLVNLLVTFYRVIRRKKPPGNNTNYAQPRIRTTLNITDSHLLSISVISEVHVESPKNTKGQYSSSETPQLTHMSCSDYKITLLRKLILQYAVHIN